MYWILEGQVQVATCLSVIGKYREVLRRPKFRAYGFPPFWLEFLIEESLQLPEPPAWTEPMPDPKDTAFLSLSYMAGAWLVTGNLRHYPEAARKGVTVLSPADYLTHLG